MSKPSSSKRFENESIILLYINKNPSLYTKVNANLFEDRFLGKFYNLCKVFFKKYKTQIFDTSNKATEQIRHFAPKAKELIIYDPKLSVEDNLEMFMNNVAMVFSIDISQYSDESTHDNFAIWYYVRSAYTSIQRGIELFKTSQEVMKEYSLSDIKTELDKVKKVMNGGFNLNLDEDDGVHILDHKAHIQPNALGLLPSGYPTIDRWVSGQDTAAGGGGFEPGTLTYLIGAPNAGKSIFLWNFAYNMWLQGADILGISLEMATYKIAKRIGANAFNIPINTYTNFSNDEARFNESVKEFKSNCLGVPGDFFLKRYGEASVSDIKIYHDRMQNKHGKKFHIVLDYATELKAGSGLASEKMYSYHKENANDMFNMAVDENIAFITAHQLHLKYKGMNDVGLQMLAESSGITQRPDYFLGLIQDPEMKQLNKYEVKNLKARDSGELEHRTTFAIDYQHMRLTGATDSIEPMHILQGGM
jgi:hypothetical protein